MNDLREDERYKQYQQTYQLSYRQKKLIRLREYSKAKHQHEQGYDLDQSLIFVDPNTLDDFILDDHLICNL